MKTLILFIIVLVTIEANGQSKKLIYQYSKLPKSDTCYVYIEGRYKNKEDKSLVQIWQQDLQTGERWFSLCDKNWKILPKKGQVLRLHRSQMSFISKNKY